MTDPKTIRRLTRLSSGLRTLGVDRVVTARLVVNAFEKGAKQGIPEQYRVTLASPRCRRDTEPMLRALGLARKGKGSLVLQGPTDVGKSSAAAQFALLTAALWLRASVVQSWTRDDWSRERPKLASYPALVIDDPGGTDAKYRETLERCAGLLISRHEDGLVTLMTTNLSPEDYVREIEQVDVPSSRFWHALKRREGEWVFVPGPRMSDSSADDARDLEEARELVHDDALVQRLGVADYHLDEDVEHLPADERGATLRDCLLAFARMQKTLGISFEQIEAAVAAEDDARLSNASNWRRAARELDR
jgi:hypothetical protein